MNQYKTLQVSFLNMELSQSEQDLSDLGCYIQLKSDTGHHRFVENLILSNMSNRAFIPISNNQDKIQFIVKRILFNKLVGSLSVPVVEFKQIQMEEEWNQWLTLFDTVDDDNFDGQLVTNDDQETPRICLSFKLLTQEVRSPSPMKSIDTDSVYGYSATPSQTQQDAPIVNQFVMAQKSNSRSKSNSKQQDQQYSPQFDLHSSRQVCESSCQVNIISSELQQSFILRLELEKMNEIQRKYDHSKRALQRMQEEYEELIKEQTSHMEEKDQDLAKMSLMNCQLRSRLDQEEHNNRIQQSEIETYRNLSSRTQEQHFHTFQQPQGANNHRTKLIIDDMAKQLKNTKIQLQQSEDYKTVIESQYTELSEQFKQIINENTVQRVQMLRQMQSAEETQTKQSTHLNQLTDKCRQKSKMLDQKLNENNFLEREVQRLIQDCEWSQKTIFNLNQSLEDMKLRHLEEYKNMQDELNSTASDLNSSETDRNVINQNFQIKSTQLDSYQSVVGSLDNYMGLLQRYQETELKKSSLQVQVTELTTKTNDEMIISNQSLQRRRMQLKEEYDTLLDNLKQENHILREQSQDQTTQIKALSVELVKITLIVSQLQVENEYLSEQNNSLQLMELQKELLEIQMIKLTEDYISKTQDGLQQNSINTQRGTLNPIQNHPPKRTQNKFKGFPESYQTNDDVDQAITQLQLPIRFHKLGKGLYQLGEKQLQIYINDTPGSKGILKVRYSDNVTSLIQFLKVVLVQELINQDQIDSIQASFWQQKINKLCEMENQTFHSSFDGQIQEDRPLLRYPKPINRVHNY